MSTTQVRLDQFNYFLSNSFRISESNKSLINSKILIRSHSSQLRYVDCIFALKDNRQSFGITFNEVDDTLELIQFRTFHISTR